MSETTAPVSAVMSAYNAESFICQAIESVFRQTLPVAEFIVIDDGSTDQTARIAESMGVRVIRQRNTGLSGARNRCVRESSQPWIAFIDADDIWEPDKIQQQMRVISKYPEVGLVTCDYATFNSNGPILRSGLEHYQDDYQAQRKTSRDGAALIRQLDEGFSSVGYFLVPSAVMVRRALLELPEPFDEHLWSAEDFECFLRVLAQSPMALVEKVLIHRREHGLSVSSHSTLMALSCVAATQKILGQPNLYPPAAVTICRNSLPAHLRHAGARQLWSGDAKSARELLMKSVRLQMDLRTLLALGASLAPFRLGRDLMSARYYISKRLGI